MLLDHSGGSPSDKNSHNLYIRLAITDIIFLFFTMLYFKISIDNILFKAIRYLCLYFFLALLSYTIYHLYLYICFKKPLFRCQAIKKLFTFFLRLIHSVWIVIVIAIEEILMRLHLNDLIPYTNVIILYLIGFLISFFLLLLFLYLFIAKKINNNEFMFFYISLHLFLLIFQ